MNDVDKLTLELFTNKNTYRRYLAKNDPETFQKQERLQEKICEHKSEILERFEEILENPSLPSGELSEIFERFMSVLLQEIESSKLREMESRTDSPFLVEDYSEKNGEEDDDDDDTMFPVTKMSASSDTEKKSFWSKDRVIKRETYSEAILSHYPTNSEIRKRYVGKRMVP